MSLESINRALAAKTITGSVYGPKPKKYSVSYYVESESYWQFAGEFPTRAKARERKKFLENSGLEKVRIREI